MASSSTSDAKELCSLVQQLIIPEQVGACFSCCVFELNFYLCREKMPSSN
jgi:hypothetical protein